MLLLGRRKSTSRRPPKPLPKDTLMSAGSQRPPISSARNPRILRVRKLHRRSHRTREGAFIIEGPSAVREALQEGAAVQEVIVSPDADGQLVALAMERGIDVVHVTAEVMEAASATSTPQGVVAVAALPSTTWHDLPADLSLALILADVRDPGNAGTLVRTAEAAGAGAVAFLGGSVDPFGPKTVRSAAGAIARMPVLRDQTPDLFGELRAREFKVIGASPSSTRSVYDVDLTGRVAIVVGNEAAGLDPDVTTALDHEVSIPMPGPTESLNAAVAGSILLFEAVRQRERDAAGAS